VFAFAHGAHGQRPEYWRACGNPAADAKGDDVPALANELVHLGEDDEGVSVPRFSVRRLMRGMGVRSAIARDAILAMRRRLRALSLRRIRRPDAHQLRGISGRQKARRRRARGHQQVRQPPRVLSYGSAMKDPGRASSRRCSTSSICTSSPSKTRVTATSRPQDRGVRRLAVRGVHNIESWPARSSRGRSTIFVGQEFRAVRAQSGRTGFATGARPLEREPELLKHGRGFVFTR